MEVPGGRLAIETFTSVNEPVLAIHGVSSQRWLWNWLSGGRSRTQLGHDHLRGHGDSVAVSGPSSMSSMRRT